MYCNFTQAMEYMWWKKQPLIWIQIILFSREFRRGLHAPGIRRVMLPGIIHLHTPFKSCGNQHVVMGAGLKSPEAQAGSGS